MVSGSHSTHAFDTHYLRVLFAASPSQWVRSMGGTKFKISDQEVLLFPFDASGHKSLFVIIGANNIRNYTAKGFKGNRPCIVHLDPNDALRGKHDHHAVSDKLRTWLNRIWRWEHSENDFNVMPFNKRTIPHVRPYGMLSHLESDMFASCFVHVAFFFLHTLCQYVVQQLILMLGSAFSDTPPGWQAWGQKEPLQLSLLTKMDTKVSSHYIKSFPTNGKRLQIFVKNVYDWCAAFRTSILLFANMNQIPPYPFEWQKKDAYAAVPQQLSSQEA